MELAGHYGIATVLLQFCPGATTAFLPPLGLAAGGLSRPRDGVGLLERVTIVLPEAVAESRRSNSNERRETQFKYFVLTPLMGKSLEDLQEVGNEAKLAACL